MKDFIFAVLSSYITTLVITKGSIFESFRKVFKKYTPILGIPGYPHFIECRLCVCFWVSLSFTYLFNLDMIYTISVYGLSYFLATQER